jgi:hypothetical protein
MMMTMNFVSTIRNKRNHFGLYLLRLLLLVSHVFLLHPVVTSFVTVSAQQQQLNNTIVKPIESTSIIPLTKSKLELIAYTGMLSASTFIHGVNKSLGIGERCYTNPPNTNDEPIDAYCTLDKDSYCYVYFKGSAYPNSLSSASFTDWIIQNLNPRKQYIKNRNDPTSIGCIVSRGFYLNDKGAGLTKMNSFIKSCMANGKRKQLVFTGHSQGAGSAGVAAIIYTFHKPLTNGFGTPAFLAEQICSLINPKHIWRIINTENSKDHSLQYDPVSFLDILIKALLPGFLTDARFHVGEALFLPPNNENDFIPTPPVSQLLYRSQLHPDPYGPPNALDVLPDNGGKVTSAHDILWYNSKLQYMLDNTPVLFYPFNLNGFVDGTQCQQDFECRSFTNTTTTDGGCVMRRCKATRQRVGKPCRSHNDCSTRICKLSYSTIGTGQHLRRRCARQQ